METITSRRNPLFQTIRGLNASAALRGQAGLFVGEGFKLLEEAVKWDAGLDTVVSVPGAELPPLTQARRVETPADVLRSLCDTATPQGVLFTCRLPNTALPGILPPGRYLILDALQDPGNLGTVWRCADALGAGGVILTGACADPFSPKVVRATMGACFRLPLWRGEPEEISALLEKSGIPLYATALREDAEDVRRADLASAAVVIGSEGRGVSERMLSLSRRTLRIPMEDRCESLNAAVAAAIVLWEGFRGSRPAAENT